MTQDDTPEIAEIIDSGHGVKNKVFVTIHGLDWQRDLKKLGLTFDSSAAEIMGTVAPIILEEFEEDITNLYKIKKITNNQNVFIMPSATTG